MDRWGVARTRRVSGSGRDPNGDAGPRVCSANMAGGEVVLVDLVKRFADVTAVAGINLSMPSGEFFSLLGPSGCGKTTTLRLIAGFERPDEGQILLDGVDMAQTPPHKRNVNTVFQNYALFPHLSVAENVAFGLRYKEVSKQDAKKRVGGRAGAGPAPGLERRRPVAALGWAAAAGGARPRADPEPGRAPARRAARARSTPSSARRCRSSSRRCRRRSASRSSTSRTTRRRRSRCPTGSP